MKLTAAYWPTCDGVGCIIKVTVCKSQLQVRWTTKGGIAPFMPVLQCFGA